MVDASFKNNFKREFQEGQLAEPHLNKTVWRIIALVVSIVLTIVTWGAAWWTIALVAVAWAAVTVVVNLAWSNYDKVHAANDARKMRAYLAALNRHREMGGKDIATGGQLVNTRQSNDPLRVIYGRVKTGGVWVFNKMSRASNQMMNTVITWGEGEISGLATGLDERPVFSGTLTLDDLHLKGEFVYASCACDMTCYSYVPCSCNMVCYIYA